MLELLDYLRRWAEVWPLLIPLFVFLLYRPVDKDLGAVLTYSIISFFLLLIAVIQQQHVLEMPSWFKNNGILYNLNSVIRTLFIGWYIYQMRPVKQHLFARYVLPAYILFLLVYFYFFANLFNFDVILFTAESIVLLILSLTFFLSSIIDDEMRLSAKDPVFIICVGISLYESVNFFINLFMYALSDFNHKLGYLTFEISRYSVIVLCLLLGTALYQGRRKKALAVHNMNIELPELSEQTKAI